MGEVARHAAASLEGFEYSKFQAERLIGHSAGRRGVEELDSGEGGVVRQDTAFPAGAVELGAECGTPEVTGDTYATANTGCCCEGQDWWRRGGWRLGGRRRLLGMGMGVRVGTILGIEDSLCSGADAMSELAMYCYHAAI